MREGRLGIKRSSLVALCLALVLMLVALIFPKPFESNVQSVVGIMIAHTEWVYLTGFTLVIVVLLLIGVSPIGRMKFGGTEAQPQMSTLSWVTLIFTSTQGGAIIGLSVYQPLAHKQTPVFSDAPDGGMAEALSVTMYTWGFHAWAIWSLLAVIVGYYSYNRIGANSYVGAVQAGLGPRAHPVLQKSLTDLTDVATLLACWFGLSTSLAIICRQISGGIVHLLEIPGPPHQFGPYIAIVGTLVFTKVALTGIGTTLKNVSNLNLAVTLVLVVAVFFLGDSVKTLSILGEGGLQYLASLIPFSFEILISDLDSAISYRRDWGMSFLMWWLVYSSMFAVLFARISYGRTFRATIGATCLIPTLICLAWFGVMSITGAQTLSGYPDLMAALDPAKTVYDFFSLLFGHDAFVWAILVISILFLITTGAPAIYVMSELLTGSPKAFSPRMVLSLGACIGVVLAVSAGVENFQALQSIAVTISFPFSLIYLAVILLGIRGFVTGHAPITAEEAKTLAPKQD